MINQLEAAGQLRLAVYRLTRQLRGPQFSAELTMSQLSALRTIAHNGPLHAGEVADREGIKPPSATRVIAGLVAEGFISRVPDPRDGRQILLTATPKGMSQMERDMRARDEWLAQLIAELSDADREALTSAVPALVRLTEIAPQRAAEPD